MLKKTCSVLLLTFIIAVSSSANALFTRDQRISDAQTLIALFEHRYAPLQWKEDLLGISFDDLISGLIAEAYKENLTDLEFYAAMAKFSGGVKDTHNWFIIPSNYRADLGFTCDYVEGRVLIAGINRVKLPKDLFPYERGDELISMNGTTVHAIIDELSEYASEGNPLAEKRFLASDLTHRRQRYFPYIPTGNVTLEIFSQSRGTSESTALQWEMRGKPLAATTNNPLLIPVQPEISKTTDTSSDEMKNPLERLRWSAIDPERATSGWIRDPEPFFPMWGSYVNRTDSPLVSGIFLLNGYRIGFLRIPTWAPPGWDAWLEFLEKQIPYLEKETDALLIDQTDNGGGSICLGETVSEFLVNEPIPANLFQIRANRHFLQMMEEWYIELTGLANQSKDQEIARKIIEEIRDAIEEERPLTDPISICFSDGYIHPHTTKTGIKTVYTKPILMLINEWSISTADMTPAPLQDAGRAVMFGGTTCGAGGNVETTSVIGHSDFRISQTESLTVRPTAIMTENGVPTNYLENVGVIPDVPYEVTADDFVNGYQGYKKAVEETLLKMLKK
ncbi:MAG: protease-like activity factor CPAF [Deltaproteobacteria bacterium]|jgi:hypothetical protein|nr:protease-like activity factor CPAF [Deltaproteobacteria bacterium]